MLTQISAVARPSPLAIARDLALLAKPRLSSLVICTTAGGIWLAPGRVELPRALATLVGTTAVVGAANALNNWLERDTDALMRRTRDRPLPSGRIDPWVAVALGLAVPAVAIPALALFAGPLTAFLAALALFTYVCIYTPLKLRTPLALFVGAVPGAIPPLIGWTSVTGRLEAGGLALFALLFCWQLPHFLAVSIYLEEDYRRGGLQVFSLVHGERAAQGWALATTLLLVPVSLILLPLGLAGAGYAAVALLAGSLLAGYALYGLTLPKPVTRWARNFFLGTLVYLTVVFAALFAWSRAP
ncbi:MAG TPA: heme o synthase [Anaeromyxobacteraceae bacterium]|nr:heme o synthase [Anaeromyxobacteraceae bacterium]